MTVSDLLEDRLHPEDLIPLAVEVAYVKIRGLDFWTRLLAFDYVGEPILHRLN